MVGIGLVAALLVGAMAAGSASASDPYTQETWGQYKGCPWELYGEPEPGNITDCFAGITAGGSKGGYFEYGHVKVKLNKSITLQGGYKSGGSKIEVVPATHGRETLEAPELKVTGGIGVLTPQIQKEVGWPAALTESWKAAKKAKETGVNVKIEMAGNECFEVPGCLNTENILFETGTAFRLPLKVKVTGPWLETLGGGPCYIGSDENPIHINLTAGDAGRAGHFTANEEFTNLFFSQTKLVDMGWHIPQVSGASGCGGPEYESLVNKALNVALEIESPEGSEISWRTGIVVLQGSLHDGAASVVLQEGEATGELP